MAWDGLSSASGREIGSWSGFPASPSKLLRWFPSLTLVQVLPDRFSVALIPHTLTNTTLGFKGPGDSVNIETDILAKYVHKYLSGVK
jgi:hypothetical protein